MITIIAYNKNKDQFLIDFFESNSIPYKFTLIENKICNSDKIILPHTTNILRALKKISLHNLGNYLQLVKKPMLGINNGFKIMCNNILDIDKTGLGFFNIDVNSLTELKSNDIGEIQTLSSEQEKLNNKEIYFDSSQHLGKTKFTQDSVNLNGKEYSLTLKKENYFGLELDIEKNPLIAESILRDFVNC